VFSVDKSPGFRQVVDPILDLDAEWASMRCIPPSTRDTHCEY
jgi:hypothetical protein